MTHRLLLSQKHLEWHENLLESIVQKLKDWLHIALWEQAMKELYTKRTDGLRCLGQDRRKIAGLEERT